MYAGYNTQGSFAVAVGRESGGANQGASSVAIGNSAGNSGQSVNAVAIGKNAGETSQGSSATAVGPQSGLTSQGNFAVAMGVDAGKTSQGSNSIAIGNGAGAANQGANGIIINSGGVAINRSTTNHIMLYSGSGKYMEYNGTDSWTFNGGGVTLPNDDLLVGKTTAVGISSTGFEARSSGVTYTSYSGTQPCAHFNRGSNGKILSFNIGFLDAGGVNATQSGTPAFVAASDERLKDNIVDHESELANVMSLRPARWDWKDEVRGSGEGFIAQELEATAWSDLVSEGEDGFKTVSGLGTVETRLIKAMQEQQAMIETLQAEVAALKGA
jgi:hypothetical protein